MTTRDFSLSVAEVVLFADSLASSPNPDLWQNFSGHGQAPVGLCMLATPGVVFNGTNVTRVATTQYMDTRVRGLFLNYSIGVGSGIQVGAFEC